MHGVGGEQAEVAAAPLAEACQADASAADESGGDDRDAEDASREAIAGIRAARDYLRSLYVLPIISWRCGLQMLHKRMPPVWLRR